MTTVMSMLIVPILLEVLNAPVGLALKEVAYFAEVNRSIYQCQPIFQTFSCISLSDINECARRLDTCSDFAVCTNTLGSFECTCFPGYRGDGQVCTGIL